MATALQQQLAAIAANSTHQLDLKAQKTRHSKSLLFEPREAASQSFDTIYQICYEGFGDLCQLDGRFTAFAKNLFSDQSKNEDRTQMTAKENQELDQVIERFLGLLGSRLLLKPGVKAAEWLVRRFRTHEYNTEVMLQTFLPYHSSPIFAVLLSILPESIPTNFRFLHPYIASRQCPPRHVIVAAVTSNPVFMAAFSQRIFSVAKLGHHSVLLIGFWASVTAQAVNGMIDSTRSGRDAVRRQREEDLLLRILPVLQSALTFKRVPELYLGACMIMTILTTRLSPQEKVISAMQEAVAGGWSDHTWEDGLTCLAVMAEEKEDISLPASVVRATLKIPELPETLLRVSDVCRIDKFVTGLCIAMASDSRASKSKDTAEILAAILDAGILQDTQIDLLVRMLRSGSAADASSGPLALDCNPALVSITQRQNAKSDLIAEQHDQRDLPDQRSAADDVQTTFDPTTLPTVSPTSWSFVNPQHSKLQETYRLCFKQVVGSPQDEATFLALPGLQKTASLQQPHFFTFLVSIWCTEEHVTSQLEALKLAQIELDTVVQNRTPLVDLQLLFPYILVALADPQRAVRGAAAALFTTYGRFLSLLMDNKKSSGLPKIWAKDCMYGTRSKPISSLSPADQHRVVIDTLLPHIDDCITDRQHVVQVLVDMLNPSSKTHTEKNSLSSSIKSSFVSILAAHACLSPVTAFKLRILGMLKHVGKHAASARVDIIIPCIEQIVAEESEIKSSSDRQILVSLMENVSARSDKEIEVLRSIALKGSASRHASALAFLRLRQTWNSMNETMQLDLVKWLLALVLEDDHSDATQGEALDVLRSVSLPTSVLVSITENFPAASEMYDQPSSAKKQRTHRVSDAPKFANHDNNRLDAAIRRLTLVLELIEGAKPENHPELIRGLFYLLSELHHYKTMLGSELAYLQGSLINSLLSVVDALRTMPTKDVDRSVIRADLIVECVRTTSSTQVHHAALLLMSSLAAWAPDLVLHSVMPLFTFMSSTILKQSDDYSAHVTEQTVARIIPPLAASLKKHGKDLISGAADLLLSFTAAFEHIPIHRRLGLFQHLVSTLGSGESLFAVVAMLIERYSDEPTVPQFVAELMDTFPANIQLRAIKQFLDLVVDTLQPKRGSSDLILAFGEKTNEQAKSATSGLLAGISEAIQRGRLSKSLAKNLKKDDDDAEKARVLYAELLETAMQLTLRLKEDRILGPNAERTLSALLSLMPTKDFIDSSARLMQGGSDDIRQQVFRSLEQRAQTAKRGDKDLQKIFIDVLPNCTWFISVDQAPATRHAAIACLDQIAEKFGKTDRDAVLEAAKVVAGNAALCSTDEDLKILSTLCLASMVEVLESDYMPISAETITQVLDYLAVMINDAAPHFAFYKAIFAFLDNVLDHLDVVLSGQYLERTLQLCARAVSLGEDESALAYRFSTRVAGALQPRYTLSALESVWAKVAEHGVPAVRLLITVVQHLVKRQNKTTVTEVSDALFSLLLLAFNTRTSFSIEENSEDTDEPTTYSLVDEMAMDVVLKLSDSVFRPFFVRLSEWATVRQINASQQENVSRCKSLYSFALVLFGQLKSLVTSYASYLIAHATELLHDLSASDSQERELLQIVLQTLATSFSNDQDGFWQSPTHFDTTAKALLLQLEKPSLLSPDDHIIPAITELAAAAGSPDHYKTMNTIIMSYMRHPSSDVRLAAVKCERAITDKLNIDWLAMLPEMLPFINELQEDDDGHVERETLRWMKQMEDITGQSIQDMLV